MRTKLPLLVVLGMTLVFLNSLHGQSFLTNGLVAYYPFNGNANDVSGNQNHGTNYGASLTTDRFGNVSSAFYFNGSSYVRCGSLVSRIDHLTFSAWVRNTNVASGEVGIVVKPRVGYTTAGARLGMVDGGFDAGFNNDSFDNGVNLVALDTAHRNDGNWYQAVVVNNYTSSTLYVDGVKQSQVNFPSNYTGAVSSEGMTIGAEIYETRFFSGFLDDIRIYNRALSSNEITSLYYLESKKNVQFVKMYTLDFDGLYLGTNYQLQVSTNVLSWSNWGSPFTATSVKYTNAIPIQRVDDWGKIFFRLVPQ